MPLEWWNPPRGRFDPQDTPTKARNIFSFSRLVNASRDAADWSCVGFDPILTIIRIKYVFDRIQAGHVLDLPKSAQLSSLCPIIRSFTMAQAPT